MKHNKERLHVVTCQCRESQLFIRGWFEQSEKKNLDFEQIAVYLDDQELSYSLEVERGAAVARKYAWVDALILEEYCYGIQMPEDWKRKKKLTFVVENKAGDSREILSMSTGEILRASRGEARRRAKGSEQIVLQSKSGIDFVKAYYQKHGAAAAWEQLADKFLRNEKCRYRRSQEKYRLDEAARNSQRRAVFQKMPKIQVLVIGTSQQIYETSVLTKSLEQQTYGGFQVTITDWNHLLDVVKKSESDYLFVTKDSVELAENLFYECVKRINEREETAVIYTDEDVRRPGSVEGQHPRLKPDFNLDYLQSTNYIGSSFLIHRKLAVQMEEAASAYEMLLFASERTDAIEHIPRVLFHETEQTEETNQNQRVELAALQAHYRRLELPTEVEPGERPGVYRTSYRWASQPLVSIIIANKDHSTDLDQCIQSIEEKSTYRNLEYIVVENNSTEEETFLYYDALQKRNERVHVVYWKEAFNYSKINNFGAAHARGEYLLLLNNDTAMIEPDSIGDMLGYCMREDVGIVGARLFYEDMTIQHAGVVCGICGNVAHVFLGAPETDSGYMNRIICAQNYHAVTAACLLTKKSVFDAVGGLSPELCVAFNDMDYCLKVNQLGKRIVYDPYAKFFHYESKSRGLEDTTEKIKRYHGEMDYFYRKWESFLSHDDTCYHPDLTLKRTNFSLRSVK